MKKIFTISFSVFCLMFLLTQVSYSQTFKELVADYKDAQKDKDYDEMIEILNTMLEKYPKTEPEITYFNRGNAYRNLKKHKKAIQDFTKAIEIKPDYEVAFNNRGLSYFDLDEFNNAVSDFTVVIKLKPDFAFGYFNRGNAYSGLYKYDSAVADYTKMIELKPDFADVYYNRGNKYYGMSMYQEAIEDWKKVIELDPAYKTALQEKINEANYWIEEKKK